MGNIVKIISYSQICDPATKIKIMNIYIQLHIDIIYHVYNELIKLICKRTKNLQQKILAH